MIQNKNTHILTPVEQLVRTNLKSLHQMGETNPVAISSSGHYGRTRILPPNLGEMGLEVRNGIARAEPYLRAGWKIMTRKPAFYPRGTAIYDPAYFAVTDAIMKQYNVYASYGGIHIPFGLGNSASVKPEIKDSDIDLHVHSHGTRVFYMAFAEIALRRHFLDWLYFEGRTITEYDRWALSFTTTAPGNTDFALKEALPPSFRPPAFENPPEPIPPHVGVQIRHVVNGLDQPRNSDPDWMLTTAEALAEHLKLDLMVYGHPNGCILPEGHRHSWDPARPDTFSERELGYLKSCRIMLAPNSGFVELMAWLGIPVLLEELLPRHEDCFESLRHGFAPKILCVDRTRPITEQADALLQAKAPVLPELTQYTHNRDNLIAKNFPWDI